MGLITGSTDGFADCDMVIEAVFEDMALKQSIFRELDEICKPGALLASNTSALDVNEIAAVASRPESVIGMHFFSPANVMKLLENVRGEKSSDSVVATTMAIGKKIGKVCVMVGVCPASSATGCCSCVAPRPNGCCSRAPRRPRSTMCSTSSGSRWDRSR